MIVFDTACAHVMFVLPMVALRACEQRPRAFIFVVLDAKVDVIELQ